MKRTLIALVLISLLSVTLLTAFYPPYYGELTIINKSGVKLGIQLVDPQDDENIYFLTIEKGDRLEPQEKTFEIRPATYGMVVYYMETWDPVYGYPKCGGLVLKSKLIASGKQKLVFTECTRLPRNNGEQKMRKFWIYTQFLYPYKFIY
jgi:hypothetical protein